MIDIGPIGFGGMPLSIQGRPPKEQALRTIHAVLDTGITFLDTADVYCLDDFDMGHNERLFAAAVRDRTDKARIRIGTKAGLERPNGAWTRNGSPEHIREACEQSLRSLEVEQIWLYQYHAPDEKVPFENSVEAFAELQRAGKCLHIGLSNVSIDQLDRASKIVDIVSVQNRLNPYFRESLDVAAECARRDIAFLAYSPVGGGRLAKKLPQFDVIRRIAEAHERSPYAVTLAWVRSKGKTVVPIPGARTPEHAADSASAAEIRLTDRELAEIDDTEFSRA
jgi:aryl-alcohol dehydrogenase-like predicted oxidoreductase